MAFVIVQFNASCKADLPVGALVVAGARPELGQWRPERGLRLRRRPHIAAAEPVAAEASAGDRGGSCWQGEVALPVENSPLEWKLVVIPAAGEVVWEPGNNRGLTFAHGGRAPVGVWACFDGFCGGQGPGDLIVLGDSWADWEQAWPHQWARTQLVRLHSLARGGSTSEELGTQADHVRWDRVDAAHAVVLIHTGGNDFMHVLHSGDALHTLQAGAVLTLHLLTWLFFCSLTAPCFWLRRRVAALLTILVWELIAGKLPPTWLPTNHRGLSNTCDVIERLCAEQGMRRFVVSGLPVGPALPLLEGLRCKLSPAVPRQAVHVLACLLLLYLTDLSRAFCQRCEERREGCRVFFWDEGAALDRVGSVPNFWQDDIHPTPRGHTLLAQEFAREFGFDAFAEAPRFGVWHWLALAVSLCGMAFLLKTLLLAMLALISAIVLAAACVVHRHEILTCLQVAWGALRQAWQAVVDAWFHSLFFRCALVAGVLLFVLWSIAAP